MALAERFVGMDVSRNTIEVAVRPTGELWEASIADDGMTDVADKLRHIQPELVVMEAGDGLSLFVAGTLATAGLPFALVHPRNVREFARAIGRMSRVDRNQAGLLAHFAELVRPEARPLSTELIQQLQVLRARRHDIQQMIALERSRLDAAPSIVQKDVQNHIQFLERSIGSIDEQFNRTIRYSPIWR